LFKTGNPLTTTIKSDSKPELAFLSTEDVGSFIGQPGPYFGQGKESGLLTPEEQVSTTESVRHRGAPIIFLGLHESPSSGGGALPSSEFVDADKAVAKLEGTPYFAMDVSDLEMEDSEIDAVLNQTEAAKTGATLTWLDARSVMTNVDLFHGAIFAEARSMCDWNLRNKFCAGCGARQHSMWGGWKLGCSTLMPWADNTGRKPCPSGKGLHNYTHPRSDPVVIMCAIDETGEKVLLGQNNRFKGKFYSALAGFIEPGETFEDAVKRELWEEAGVKAWDVQYHSGQPWPFPASLMCGFYARADSTQPVRIDLDNELAGT
jgi:NAD+ diphosphatase